MSSSQGMHDRKRKSSNTKHRKDGQIDDWLKFSKDAVGQECAAESMVLRH